MRAFLLPVFGVILVGSSACQEDKTLACDDGAHEESGRCVAETGSTPMDTSEIDGDVDGYSAESGDCDDADPDRHPGAVEVCNDVDDDCDDLVDNEAVDATAWFADADGDGFGKPATSQLACDAPSTYVANAEDCDDTEGTVNPGASESCGDGVDQDCDGSDLSECSLATASAQYIGEADSDWAGSCVSAAGDVNADGYDDLLIGAYGNEDGGGEYAGSVYLILGSAAPVSLGLADATAQYIGAAEGDLAGESVSGAGDVNADGFDDLVIGARGNDDGGGDYAGAAYLILGSAAPASIGVASASSQYTGEAAFHEAGSSVSGAGDVNADGFDDLLIGAKVSGDFSQGWPGAGYLILGSAAPASLGLAHATAQYIGEANGDLAGESVSGAGDVDADGFHDLLIGARGNDDGGGDFAGAAYLILGSAAPASLGLTSAAAQYTGEAASDQAGLYVSEAGDVNGDGYGDLLIGAPGHSDGAGSDAGAAYLILGSAAPASLGLGAASAQYTGETDADYAGSVSCAGDVDADGYSDMLIGVSSNDRGHGNETGVAYVIRGNTAPASLGLASADALYTGEAGNDLAGGDVAGGGDVDADGVDDLLIGARGNDDGPGTAAGAAYLILGAGF